MVAQFTCRDLGHYAIVAVCSTVGYREAVRTAGGASEDLVPVRGGQPGSELGVASGFGALMWFSPARELLAVV
jgi:hypothetical protein